MLLAASPLAQAADLSSVVNELRSSGCGARLPALTTHPELSQAARALSRSGPRGGVRELAREAGYAATQISTLHFTAVNNDADLRGLLKQHCKLLVDPEWQHLASAGRDAEVWLLLAAQQAMPRDPAATALEVLRLVNQARAAARRCGTQRLPAVSPLTLNAMLSATAQRHADDMARLVFLEHRGSNGSTAAQRVAHSGYRYGLVGENIAAGPASAAEVVSGWLRSPGHCANVMNARFKEMGLGYAINSQDSFGIYWAQVLAAPRGK